MTPEFLPHPALPDLKKWVPTKHYYWTAPAVGWPLDANQVTELPGPFFAHILCRFGLRNAYFTNIVKCRLQEDGHEVDIKPDKRHRKDDSRIRRNCVDNFLRREVGLHAPVVIFVFGGRGAEILSDEPWLDPARLVRLDHYAVVNRNMTTVHGYTIQCGQIIDAELRQRGII